MALKFSSQIPALKVIGSREKFLEKLVQDKDVLHGGCVDSGVLEEKVETGQFLHDYLMRSSKSVVGVDADCKGIERMKEMGYTNIFCADLEQWHSQTEFDVIVMGEIIEHVDNCGRFLKSIAPFCTDRTQVIFTTPNNYYYLFWLYTLWGKESIHPDHNYLFSFNSIRALLEKFGFEVTQNYVLWEGVKLRRQEDSLFKRFLKTLAGGILNIPLIFQFVMPQYGKSIIVECRYRGKLGGEIVSPTEG